jgi:uncharacterized membrane protein YfcA
MLDYLLLAASGFIAWIVSTIGGGGGAMLLVPLVGFIAGAQAVAPVAAVATLIAGGGRALVFFRDIEWRVVVWGLPGAALGGILGAVAFSTTSAEWLQIIVGLFLVSTIFQYSFGTRDRTFAVATWVFLSRAVHRRIPFRLDRRDGADPEHALSQRWNYQGEDGRYQDGDLVSHAPR